MMGLLIKLVFMLIQAGNSCKWTNDSQHLLLEHFDMIHDFPLYIYYFAIPFCPSSSWLHKYNSAEMLQGVRVIKGTPADWGTCSRTVFLNDRPFSLAYWKDTIAVGLCYGDITIFDAITGSQATVLSGHNDHVKSVAFSLDGTSLVSGSDDTTVKLWDVQTGGVVRTFSGHTKLVWSASISPDHATIASGSRDKTIRLWNVQAGSCFCVINGHNYDVKSVNFSPTNPQLLISASDDNTVRQWDISGCQVRPTYEGKGVAFSSDGTHFVSWGTHVAMVQNSDSGVVAAELKVPRDEFECCCFSPDGNFVAGGASHDAYIWDITGSDPHLIKTIIGHTDDIISLVFSSCLISASNDKTVKFWQIGALSAGPVTTDKTSATLTPCWIESVGLQVRDGVAISSDEAGVVKTWDILTGLCKASFQTPATGQTWRDAQLIQGRLIVIWYEEPKICILDVETGEFLQPINTPGRVGGGVRISGDGSKVFGLVGGFILAWSIWTGEAVGKVEVGYGLSFDTLHVDGSRVWARSKKSPAQGWDFGISGSSPFQLSNTPPDRPHLNLSGGTEWDDDPCMIKDMVTGRVVFQLAGGYANPRQVQWDGQYLVAGYESGEVLILDFNHLLLQ